jgi:hypothetical protein
MKYPPITYALLKEKKACEEELALFRHHIGLNEPIPLNDETIQKFADLFDIEWSARNLLDLEDYLEYKKISIPAYQDFENMRACAWVKCDCNSKSLIGNTWGEYTKILHQVQSKYFKIVATEFVRLYLAE